MANEAQKHIPGLPAGRTLTNATVANAVNAAAAPTQTEFNNFVTQFNALLTVLKNAGILS